MKKWSSFFKQRKQANDTTTEPVNSKAPEAVVKSEHDYGIHSVSFILMTRDYGWTEPDPDFKKVVLTNPEDCKDRLNAYALAFAWRETGHAEWEALMAFWFTDAVIRSLEEGESEADITHIFNRDYLASNNKIFSKEQVYNHLIRWFDIVEETDDIIKLKLRI